VWHFFVNTHPKTRTCPADAGFCLEFVLIFEKNTKKSKKAVAFLFSFS